MSHMSFAARPLAVRLPVDARLALRLTGGALAASAVAALGWSGAVDVEILGAGALLLGAVALPRVSGAGSDRAVASRVRTRPAVSTVPARAAAAQCDALARHDALVEQWTRDAQRDAFGLPGLASTGGAPAREAAVALELDGLLDRFDRLPPSTGGAQVA